MPILDRGFVATNGEGRWGRGRVEGELKGERGGVEGEGEGEWMVRERVRCI